MRKLILSIAVLMLSCLAQTATPAAGQGFEQTAERMEALKTRLKLTPDQIEKIQPILQKEGEQLKALRPEGGFPSLSRREKFKVGKEMKGVREQTDKELATVLSKDQMSELKKFRSEQRERMKQQMEARR